MSISGDRRSVSAPLLGALFATAICPVCTPALVVLLGVAAGTGSLLWGALLLLLALSLGRSVPAALGAGTAGWLDKLQVLQRHQRRFDIVSGLLLIVMAAAAEGRALQGQAPPTRARPGP